MMKKLLIASIIVASIIIAGLLSLPEYDKEPLVIENLAEASTDAYKITLNTELPEQIEAISYEVIGEMDKKTAMAIAERFGMDGDIVPPGDGEYLKAINDSSNRKLIIYPEGSITYYDFSKLWVLPKTIPNLPARDKAIDIAVDYLMEMNLLPEDAQVKKVVSDQLTKKDRSTGEVIESIDTNLQVIFGRELNGIPVTGLGSELKVYIGDNGEVIGLHKVWREVEASGTMKIKPCKDAFEELKQSTSLPLGCSNVSIDDVHIAYYETGPGVKQDYLEPIWVFKGQAFCNGKTMEIERTIPAEL